MASYKTWISVFNKNQRHLKQADLDGKIRIVDNSTKLAIVAGSNYVPFWGKLSFKNGKFLMMESD